MREAFLEDQPVESLRSGAFRRTALVETSIISLVFELGRVWILEYLGMTHYTTSKAVCREGEECNKTRPISTRWSGG